MARWVQPGYFETMGIPLLKGRDIVGTDLPNAPRVVVISESIARVFFPGRDPIGKLLNIWQVGTAEIVGIVGDARLNRVQTEPDWAIYMSHAQMDGTRMWLVTRTAGDPTSAVEPIRRILRRKDPNVLFAEPSTMTSRIDNTLADFRIVVLSLALFAGIALLLSAIGIYGVLAYHVSQRKNEIGIRMALGATQFDLLALVIRRGALLVTLGLLVGLAAAYPASQLIRQILFETVPLDPAAYGGSILILTAAALLACFLPAWRATRVSPIEALRVD
jgi:predicted permease